MDMQEDAAFFAEHPDRNYHIREPVPFEYVGEFLSLGPHQPGRRRILIARVDKRRARKFLTQFARIPFLLFADETVEDRDDILEPLFKKILNDTAAIEGRTVMF